MGQKGTPLIITILFVSTLVFSINNVKAQGMPADTVLLKAENAKRPSVLFPHGAHVKTISCTVCHHKDKDPTRPGKCGKCHPVKGINEKAIPMTDAFHTQCKACHKEHTAKGVSVPTKCNECHKK
jgi:hypothetical protein